jgi:CAAX prenyl protease-like protein
MLGFLFTDRRRPLYLRVQPNSDPGPPPPAYFAATRHPLPCLVFLLPLLVLYEGSVLYLGGTDPNALRNGADFWLHGGLGAFGLQEIYWAPALLVVALLLWCCVRWADRPQDLVGICSGMAIESVFAALGLWVLSRGMRPVLDHLGVTLAFAPAVDETTANLVSYLGAGIYEEVLFRLILFGGLCLLLRALLVPSPVALPVATAVAALAFATAHHVGPYGERFDGYVFAFRTVAGLYFTLIYRFRGFGIVVGAHACYDVFVGIAAG